MIKMQMSGDARFTPDFSRILLRVDGTCEYLISRDISLSLMNLFVLHEEEEVYLTMRELIIASSIFEDRRLIDRKIKLFEMHEEDRVRRFFVGDLQSVFFESDQIYRLDELVMKTRILCDAEILYKGQPTEINKLPEAGQRAVVDAMNLLGFVYDLSPEEYRGHFNKKRVKIIAKRKDYEKGGVKPMKKSQLILKGIGGSFLVAVGASIAIAGTVIVSKAAQTLFGLDKEVILIEDNEDEE